MEEIGGNWEFRQRNTIRVLIWNKDVYLQVKGCPFFRDFG
jgi:hypothetical protein